MYRGVHQQLLENFLQKGCQGAGAGHQQPPKLDWDDGQPGPDQQLAGKRVSKGHIVSGQQYCGAAQQKVAPFHQSTWTGLFSDVYLNLFKLVVLVLKYC